MPQHEHQTRRSRSRVDCCRAIGRPRRCDGVSGAQFGRRRSVGRSRVRLWRQPARRRLRVRVRQLRGRPDGVEAVASHHGGQCLRADLRPAGFPALCHDGRRDLSRAPRNRSGHGASVEQRRRHQDQPRRPHPRAHRLSGLHAERQSAVQERAADLRGAQSGVLKEQLVTGHAKDRPSA